MKEQELVSRIDGLLNASFDGDFTRIDGKLKWRIGLADRITMRESILVLTGAYYKEKYKGYVKLAKAQIVKGIRFPDGVSLQQVLDILLQLKGRGWRKVEVRDEG